MYFFVPRVKVCQVYREDEYNREPMVLVNMPLFNSTVVFIRFWFALHILFVLFFSHGYFFFNLSMTIHLWWVRHPPREYCWQTVKGLKQSIIIHCCVVHVYQTQDTLEYQTPRRELKTQHVVEYFWRNLRCLEIGWNTVSSIWYIFSIESKSKE